MKNCNYLCLKVSRSLFNIGHRLRLVVQLFDAQGQIQGPAQQLTDTQLKAALYLALPAFAKVRLTLLLRASNREESHEVMIEHSACEVFLSPAYFWNAGVQFQLTVILLGLCTVEGPSLHHFSQFYQQAKLKQLINAVLFQPFLKLQRLTGHCQPVQPFVVSVGTPSAIQLTLERFEQSIRALMQRHDELRLLLLRLIQDQDLLVRLREELSLAILSRLGCGSGPEPDSHYSDSLYFSKSLPQLRLCPELQQIVKSGTKAQARQHLVVLLHGFMGNSNDLREYRNLLKRLNPNLVFVHSNALGISNSLSIEFMGRYLAKETEVFCSQHPSLDFSFLTFSLGGIVALSSLAHLPPELRKRVGYLFALACPFVGYTVPSLTRSGAQVFSLFEEQMPVLKEITLSDTSEVEKSLLFRLAHCDQLQCLKGIVTFSSKEDRFAPLECSQLLEKGVQPHDSMVNSFLRRCQVLRAVASQQCEGSFLERLIGKRAHLFLLFNRVIIHMVALTISSVLKNKIPVL